MLLFLPFPPTTVRLERAQPRTPRPRVVTVYKNSAAAVTPSVSRNGAITGMKYESRQGGEFITPTVTKPSLLSHAAGGCGLTL